MTTIDKTLYSTLFSYVILAQTGITIDAGSTTTINGTGSGSYFSSNPTSGTISGGTLNTTDLSTARPQINALIAEINNLTLTPTTFSGTNLSTLTPGLYKSPTGGAITGTTFSLTFDGLLSPNSQFFIVSDTAITYTDLTISLINGASASNIFWVARNGDITFVTPGSAIGGYFINNGGNQAYTFGSPGTLNGAFYSRSGEITITDPLTINPQPVCYLKGTKILTASGYIPIEDIRVGDIVCTMGKIHNEEYVNVEEKISLETVIWTGSFRPAYFNESSFPVCIKAHAFGTDLPSENLYVSPAHRILVDGKMIAAFNLINGNTIYQDTSNYSLEYYHLELGTHSSIIANGVLSESYIDNNNRIIFEKKVTPLIVQTPLITSC